MRVLLSKYITEIILTLYRKYKSEQLIIHFFQEVVVDVQNVTRSEWESVVETTPFSGEVPFFQNTKSDLKISLV